MGKLFDLMEMVRNIKIQPDITDMHNSDQYIDFLETVRNTEYKPDPKLFSDKFVELETPILSDCFKVVRIHLFMFQDITAARCKLGFFK